ncbi:hypothetical protein [uncultured Paludibaculum sp.]|uniref:hypothetical protein n=1 Tax=uncultured Paludibaculum sp. TaxID=1765020 RepID=UPI002AAB29C8|nr:hypothetical protein [uncultured Paludibaculum sp.]
MVSAQKKAARTTPVPALREQIESFLAECRQPAALEPGELPFCLSPRDFRLSDHPAHLQFEVWDERRTLTRRITGIQQRRSARLVVNTARFGDKPGLLTFTDLARPQSAVPLLQGSRSVLRELLRRWLARQFPGWTVDQITTGADLQHTLSPACPRACLTKGDRRMAALAVPEEHAADALTHGLIWLAYLRRRHPIQGLALFLPCGTETATLLRLRHLNVDCRPYRYDESGFEAPIDPDDHGNLITRLEPWQEGPPEPLNEAQAWVRQLELQPDVQGVQLGAGIRSLRIHGLEFARYQEGQLWSGIYRKEPASNLSTVEQFASELATFRQTGGPVPDHPWRVQQPEAWLESLMRRQVDLLDARLLPAPVYGQVPALTGCERSCLDLLAIERGGRLAVIELKVSEDPNLPLQALDYWIRVAHHAACGDFRQGGYFPGLPISCKAPRLLLVAPALQFHPTTETLLGFFASNIQVERIGLGVEWQRMPRVVLRALGARSPEWDQTDL